MNRKGYTLTEAMLTVAIVGAIAALAAPLLMQMTNFWRQTTARNEIQKDVRASLDIMNRFVRQAQGGTTTVGQAPGQPAFSSMTFITVQGQTVSFYQTGNKLYMSLNGSSSILSRNLAYVAFAYPKTDDSSLISIAITTQMPTYKGGRKALQLSIQKVRIMN